MILLIPLLYKSVYSSRSDGFVSEAYYLQGRKALVIHHKKALHVA